MESLLLPIPNDNDGKFTFGLKALTFLAEVLTVTTFIYFLTTIPSRKYIGPIKASKQSCTLYRAGKNTYRYKGLYKYIVENKLYYFKSGGHVGSCPEELQLYYKKTKPGDASIFGPQSFDRWMKIFTSCLGVFVILTLLRVIVPSVTRFFKH